MIRMYATYVEVPVIRSQCVSRMKVTTEDLIVGHLIHGNMIYGADFIIHSYQSTHIGGACAPLSEALRTLLHNCSAPPGTLFRDALSNLDTGGARDGDLCVLPPGVRPTTIIFRPVLRRSRPTEPAAAPSRSIAAWKGLLIFSVPRGPALHCRNLTLVHQ
jgi:hypothetical protein